MVISSIDLQGGQVVQLKNGRDLVIKRHDPYDLIADFDKYGKVAVIDLDAAMGTGDNLPLLKSLLRRGEVRCGGGIRTIERARELVSLGAQKVIVGSAAFSDNAADVAGVADAVNTAFLKDLMDAIGRQRVIVSIDALNDKIAIHGWRDTINLDYITAAKQAEPYCSEYLFTCVEREGCMTGANLAASKKLRLATANAVTVAGGVSNIDEIVALEKLGCDVQLGMALYTGAVKLSDAFVNCIDFDKGGGLAPVIAQSPSGQVLMLGYANREALYKTIDSGRLTFYSRSRRRLWTKGETSGHYLDVVRLRADCDRDTILATVTPHGTVCHKGSYSCFSDELIAKSDFQRLYDIIKDRISNPTDTSYTATLDKTRVREKVMEEAGELCEAAEKDEVIWEAADLMYFIEVLLAREGVALQDVYDELDRRHKK